MLNAGKIRKENEGLKEMLSPELQEAADINKYIIDLEAKRDKLEKQLSSLEISIKEKKKEAIFFDDAIIYQDFGLYAPRYNFIAAEEYSNNYANRSNAFNRMWKY